MGRRSQHTPDELRELILVATRRVVEAQGFSALSAREIAREIGYAPGTLYNMFSNLDEILMRVEARILEELDEAIARAVVGKKGIEALRTFATTYVEFAYKNHRLWELVQQHNPENNKTAPDWFLERMYAPMSRLEPLIGSILELSDADEVSRSARLLWSTVHGLLHVAMTPKYGALPLSTAIAMVDAIVVQASTPVAKSSRLQRRGEKVRAL